MPRLELFRGGILIGTIDYLEQDFPWHYGTFAPCHGAEEVLALFAEEAALLERGDFSLNPAWRAARDALDQPGIRIKDVESGDEFTRPLVHIRDTRVWWR